MEKTLEIRLTEQRDAIYEAIINSPSPEPRSWGDKMVWEQARIHFARLVLEARDNEERL